MKRFLLAAAGGGLAVAILTLFPLLRQQARLAALAPAASATDAVSGSRAPGPPPTDPGSILTNWRQVRETGTKAGAPLRAAQSVQQLTAAECQAAAEATLSAGDPAPLNDLLARWASLDGRAAMAWLSRHPDLFEKLLADTAPAWAAADPDGYAAWLPGYHPDASLEHVVREGSETGGNFRDYLTSRWLAPYNLPAAIRITVEKIRAAGIDQMVIARLDLQPFIRSVQDAESLGAEILAHPEWLEPVPSEKNLYLLVALRECWQDLDPAGWDRWAAAHPGMAAKADNKPVSPALAFVQASNPATVADEIMAATPPEQEGDALFGLMQLWKDRDLNAAGAWLSTRPENPAKWSAVLNFSLTAVQDDPLAALQWAASIPDPAWQDRVRRRVFARWADTDPAAARDWLPQSGWDETRQQSARDILASAKPSAHPPP
jgi:hypothetical protein